MTDNDAKNKVIAFQGSPGAYSDLACRESFPDSKTLPCDSFEAAFIAVQDGRADLAVIPIDNTLAGRVADVHHLLPDSGLHIIGELFQPIRHCLLGIPGAKTEDIKRIHSHVHALPQCRNLIRRLGAHPFVYADTAGSAAKVAADGDKSQAAIASSLSAQIYGLEILEKDVQDADHNTTRFVVLSPETVIPAAGNGHTMISMVFQVRNIPASLYKALGGFATNGVNMTKLESYVDKNFQVAQFYCEIEGHLDDQPVKNTLEELEFFAKRLTVLGCYPAAAFRGLE